MIDLQSELEALSRKFATSLAAVVKKAALESVAEMLKAGPGAPASVPDENDTPSSVPLGDAIRTPDVDVAALPLESWPERRSRAHRVGLDAERCCDLSARIVEGAASGGAALDRFDEPSATAAVGAAEDDGSRRVRVEMLGKRREDEARLVVDVDRGVENGW